MLSAGETRTGASLRFPSRKPSEKQTIATQAAVTHGFSRTYPFAALAALRVSLEEVPTFTPTYRTLAACYAHMGRLDEAREIIKRLASLTPVVVPTANPLRNPEHRELFLSGLRLAAGEVT